MKFRLTDFASIAEIIDAFAVVISLIYVGIQVNDSTVIYSKRRIPQTESE